MEVRFETDRLIIRKIRTSDAAFYVELFNSEGWLKYIGDRHVHTEAEAEAYIEKHYLSSYEQHGYGAFAVILKETGQMIGACGLYKRDNLEHPDIGFAYLPPYIGKGYGYEAAKAVMDFARKTWNITTLYGVTVEYNIASIALLEKLGLKRVGATNFEGDNEELLLFSSDA